MKYLVFLLLPTFLFAEPEQKTFRIDAEKFKLYLTSSAKNSLETGVKNIGNPWYYYYLGESDAYIQVYGNLHQYIEFDDPKQ